MHRNICGCMDKKCKELTEQYFNDPESKYPHGEKQLLFRYTNPNGSNIGRQQIYDRVAFQLGIKNPHERKDFRVSIRHYGPGAIEHYNSDDTKGGLVKFQEYLLPFSVVSNSKLGVEFTDVDKFICIGTKKELKECKKNNNKCMCNRYINAPFVCGTVNTTLDVRGARGKRHQAFASTREESMYSAEAAVQESRADRLQSQNKKLRTTVEAQQSQLEGTKKHFQTEVEAKQSQLDDIKKQLEFQRKTTSPLKKQISSLQNENESLHRTNEELITATEKSAKKERKAAKKAKASYDARKRSASPANTPDANFIIKNLGLCRQSLLDKTWHSKFPNASRDLLNFESFNDCLGYVCIFFPQLKDELANLDCVGAAEYVSKKRRLTQLEHCILCRLSSKTGATDKLIGLIYGILKSAVSKIKAKWMPKWGYAGKMLTDLEPYDDYVDNERPDAYDENDLPDVGTQCDGKDFLCESFRRSSSLNRAQYSSKMKAAAFRCITWSSPCGLVWAVTPLVLARLTENALVHWYGEFKDKDEKYVPISKSDWAESLEEEEEEEEEDDSGQDGDDSNDNDATEETMVFSIERVDDDPDISPLNQSDDDNDDDDDDDDNDERIKECYDDMEVDDMSLSGESGDGDEDEEDRCVDLDGELDKFDEEICGMNKNKKLISKDLLRIDEIKAMAQKVLNSGPDRNGKAKLEQLEMLQELHMAYEDCRLKKCLLSMYLKLTLHHREELIKKLKKYSDGKLDEPPKIPRRLAKLSRKFKVLADRGFAGDNLSYPNFNMVVTPEFCDKKTKQLTLGQLERDRKICELRYTCEVVFSRVTTEKMLSGVIPYSVFAHIENAHCWAHAQANLRMPLQPPGSKSGIGENYFED